MSGSSEFDRVPGLNPLPRQLRRPRFHWLSFCGTGKHLLKGAGKRRSSRRKKTRDRDGGWESGSLDLRVGDLSQPAAAIRASDRPASAQLPHANDQACSPGPNCPTQKQPRNERLGLDPRSCSTPEIDSDRAALGGFLSSLPRPPPYLFSDQSSPNASGRGHHVTLTCFSQ
jgi:hypothetical protein